MNIAKDEQLPDGRWRVMYYFEPGIYGYGNTQREASKDCLDKIEAKLDAEDAAVKATA